MEQYKLPKNIRQIGDREDWIRVYIEDYVHTYIQKLRGQQENSTAGGILLGKKQRINGTVHLFITGAAEAEDPFWKMPGQTPGRLGSESSVYFPDLQVCGFFMTSRQSRVSEVELLRIFENYFNTEQQVLLDMRGQDEEVYSYSGHSMVRLAGYYIYYEKNEGMQNYILRQDSFRMMGGGIGEEKEAVDFSREDELYAAARSAERKKDGSRGTKPANPEEAAGGDVGKRLKENGNAGKKGHTASDERILRQKKTSFEKRWKGVGLFGGKSAGTGERDSGPGGRQKDTDIRQTQGKGGSSVKKGKEGKVTKGDMMIRGISVAGIAVLAFLLFSDQVHLSRLNAPLSQKSGISSSGSGIESGVTGSGDSLLDVIRAGAKNGDTKEDDDSGEEKPSRWENGDIADENGVQSGDGESGDGVAEEHGLSLPVGNMQAGSSESGEVSESVNGESAGSQSVSGNIQIGSTGNLSSSGSAQTGSTGNLSASGSVQTESTGNLSSSGSAQTGSTGNLSSSGSVQTGPTGNLSSSGSVQTGSVGNPSVSGSVSANVQPEVTGNQLEAELQQPESGGSSVGSVAAHVFPMKYLVKKGDSLYAISEKYYGNTEMVDAICLENHITDPERVNYGIVLTLPVPPAN